MAYALVAGGAPLACVGPRGGKFLKTSAPVRARRTLVVHARSGKHFVNFTDSQSSSDSDIFNLDKKVNSALQWEGVRNFLNARGGVMSVSKGAVAKLIEEEGYVCIDVRTGKSFQQGFRIPGSVNVPLFKGASEVNNDLSKSARQVFFTLLTSVEATYYNEKFVDEVLQAAGGKDKPIILACAQGGLIHESKFFPKGIASRSFIAAAILIKAGFSQVAHVNGGTGEKPKVNQMDRNMLLEFIYGTELPAGTVSVPLMMVSYSLVIGYLAYLAIPKIPGAAMDFAMRAGWL